MHFAFLFLQHSAPVSYLVCSHLYFVLHKDLASFSNSNALVLPINFAVHYFFTYLYPFFVEKLFSPFFRLLVFQK